MPDRTERVHVESWRRRLIAFNCRYDTLSKAIDSARKQERRTRSKAERKRLQSIRQEAREKQRELDTYFRLRAMHECRHLCQAMIASFSQELREMVYDSLITDVNATFYEGLDGNFALVNGPSQLWHCFDSDYTGLEMYADLVHELSRRRARFDFGTRFGLLRKALDWHAFKKGRVFADVVRKVGLTLKPDHLSIRDHVLMRMDDLFELRRSTHITFFIDGVGKTQKQVARGFRAISRVFMPLWNRLRESGRPVDIVVRPDVCTAAAVNSSCDSFPVIRQTDFRYHFLPDNTDLTVEALEIWLN